MLAFFFVLEDNCGVYVGIGLAWCFGGVVDVQIGSIYELNKEVQ